MSHPPSFHPIPPLFISIMPSSRSLLLKYNNQMEQSTAAFQQKQVEASKSEQKEKLLNNSQFTQKTENTKIWQ